MSTATEPPATTSTDSAPADTPPPAKTVPERKKVVGVVVGLTLLLGIMLCAFALPAIHTGAHGITLGVAGPQDAVDKVRALDGFDVREYSSADEARTAIEQRKIYGALIVGDDNIEIMTASAASAQAAQVIGQAGPPLALRMKKGWTITDVRPFPADDPRGAGLSGGALPLALGGWIAAILIMQLIATTRNRLLAVFAFAVVGGLALTAIIQFGFGTLDGNYLLTSLAAMLGISATAMGVLGLRELLGGVGIGIAAVLLILLGNPLSGLSSAPEMLPSPWGQIGQLLPPGATGALLRGVGLFDGHGTTHALVVLICWLVVGLGFYFLGLRRAAAKAGSPAPAA
ncbi:hypothetical protein M2359_000180 [Gordonia amarae]|uniref:hypothetical protein n=1 Tax=Gordonia amarae TaxID=36821 RepID=UPI001FCAFFAC|nr:hypothetical protein [Gordonia amarae]MCS3876551.1 hypothetical protein [Gordonia amarae]